MDTFTKQRRENCHTPAKALYTRTIIMDRLKPTTTKNDIRHNYILAEQKNKTKTKKTTTEKGQLKQAGLK